MKKHIEENKVNNELVQRNHQRRTHRAFKMVSILSVISLLTVSCPIVSIGHASDISLQVPVEQTLPDASCVSDSHNVKFIELKVESEEVMDPVVDDNTFVIVEHTNRDGVPVELLDPSAFKEMDVDMYVLQDYLPVYASPDPESELLGYVPYASEVACLSKGTSWSEISYCHSEDGIEESLVGYVLTSDLTFTPIATSTPTPTPTPKKNKNTPTPTPVPESGDPNPNPDPTTAPTPTPIEEEQFTATFYSMGSVNVRSGPGTNYSVVRKLTENEKVNVVARTTTGWYRLDDGNYVKGSLLSSQPIKAPATPTPEPQPDPNPAPDPSPVDPDPNPGSDPTPVPTPVPIVIPDPSTCDLVTYARAFIGVPYLYTGASPAGFDCSGFVQYVYAHYYGISLPHQSAEIAKLGTDVGTQELQVGDVICHDYNSDGRVDHVSLYCGGGVVIHASTSRGGIVEDYLPMGCVVCVRRFF